MKLFILTVAFAIFQAQGAFQENGALWNEIDLLNRELSAYPVSSELELLFEKTMEMAVSDDLAEQFESLRETAYSTDDFTELDEYVQRAAPAITVLILGESNNIGVNVGYYLSLTEPGTSEYSFFDLALDGFYYDGRVGTAELPAWMIRTGSSAQAAADPELAEIYAGIWEGMSLDFQGVYRSVAWETISALGGEAEISGSELESYYRVYRDPFVMHVRTALNRYLDGSKEGIADEPSLMEDLNRYRDYLSDGFVVLSLDPAPLGGYNVLLISREKPDRIFDAWVYETPGTVMELRGFSESTQFNSNEVREIAERYNEFLQDHEHSL